jgi:hypothetical protein
MLLLELFRISSKRETALPVLSHAITNAKPASTFAGIASKRLATIN